MNFKPQSEKELKEKMLWPAGEYDFEISKAEPAKSGDKSKNPGTPYIKLTIRIFNKDGGERMINGILHPAMEWQLRSFCYETGLGDKYEAGTLEAADCEGRNGWLQLKVEEAKGDFPAKNAVKDWGKKATKKDKVSAIAAQAEPLDPDNDDIPF